MNIGIDVRGIHGKRTGKEVYAREITRALLIEDQKNTYIFFSNKRINLSSDFGFDSEPRNVQCKIIRMPSFLWHIAVFLHVLIRSRPDIYVAPTSYIVPALLKKRCVIVVHDIYAFLAKTHSKKATFVERLTLKRALKNAKVVLAVSQFTKNEIIRSFRVDDDKIVVVPCAGSVYVNPRNDSENPSQETALQLPQRYILFVGTIEPRKNLVRLVRAFDQIKKKPGFDTVKLVIAGKTGWGSKRVFQEVRALGREKDVVFLGYVSDDQKEELYRNATCFVFPSLYEGFGIPPLEAMANGVPVIVSSRASLPEIVGKAGLYVNPLDVDAIAWAIHNVFNDPSLASTLIEKGRERVKGFSWDSSAKQALRAIKQASDSNKANSSSLKV